MAQIVEFNGQTIEFPDGMGAREIESALKQHAMSIRPPEQAAVSAGRGLNEIPRQIGLTARYGLEGLANTAQIVTEPVRQLITDRLLPDRRRGVSDLVTGAPAQPKSRPLGEEATRFADWLGLPSPQTANERVVGDAARLVAGSGGMAGLARAGGSALAPLAANLPQQLGSAAGAGLASGASREAGGEGYMQVGAGVLGGVLGGLVPGAASAAAQRVSSLVRPEASAQQLDVRIGNLLRQQDIDYSQVPERMRQGMRAEMAAALRTGREIDPAAAARLLDFQRTGTTPTRGTLSLDPVQITREQNLAKIAANSADDTLSGLPQIQNQNNARLIGNLNELGATRGDPLRAGEVVNSAVLGRQSSLRGAERQAWDAARASPGYTQPISPAPLNAINQALGDEALMPFMNPTISRYMEAFQNGSQPFTPQHYRNLQSMLSREMAKGGNEAAAAGAARRALEATPMTPLTQTGSTLPTTAAGVNHLRGLDAQPAEALAAVDQARQATRAAYAYEESSPLVRSVLAGGRTSDPARIAQSYVINGTADEAAQLAREVGPAGVAPIRDALVNHLKEKALSGAADETGKFSQAAFNKALRQIGDRKLSLFFQPDEIESLRALGRVSSYMQAQPVGSAVNNSNSGALTLGRGYDALRSVVGKVPFGQQVVLDPLRSIDLTLSQRAARNLTGGLLAPVQRPPLGSGLVLPGLAAGGLLAPPGAN